MSAPLNEFHAARRLTEEELFATIRERFIAAKGEISKIRIDDLPFRKVTDACELTITPADVQATEIEYYPFPSVTETGEHFLFEVYRFGKYEGDDGKALLFELAVMRGINRETGEGDYYPPHAHDGLDARFIFLQGSGYALIGGKWQPYNDQSRFDAPAGTDHGFIVEKPSVFISIQTHPIRCVADGTPRADFRLIKEEPFPPEVQALRDRNRANLSPPRGIHLA